MLRRLRIENFVLIRDAELALAPGVNAVTGETGAGKTILAQAIGLLLGAPGDPAYVGPGAEEAYVEAELDLPSGLLEDEGYEALAELRPADEDGLVASRRVFADGRTRAYAWGRAVPREELARVLERLVAMSGQFEQRRLARPSFQLDVLDAFVGEEQMRARGELVRAWRELGRARRDHQELERAAAGEETRLAELRELVERTEGLGAGTEEALLGDRERLRRVGDLADAAQGAAEALAPELGDGDGAAALTARAVRALAPVSALAPELAAAEAELVESELRLREASSALRSFLASLEAEPGRLEAIETELERIADAKRRFRAPTYEELLARAKSAREELEARDAGGNPLAAARGRLDDARARVEELSGRLGRARAEAAPAFASAVRRELEGLGMGEGEFRVVLAPHEPGASGAEDVSFEIRPNRGLPFAPVAETASGGELSRIALALRAVVHAGGGEPTIVFDEVDAGIGGRRRTPSLTRSSAWASVRRW